MDDESGGGESVSPLVGGPKTHRSSVRPSASVPPACTKRRRRWRALSLRVQPTSLARATADAAALRCRPTDRPTNGSGRLAAAQKPAAQAAAAATKWGAIPSPLSQPASLAAGEGERGGRRERDPKHRRHADGRPSELRPTPPSLARSLAGWREGCTPSSCVMGALARSLPRSLAYTELMMGRSDEDALRNGRGSHERRKQRGGGDVQ